jgi:CubicO group peptidase (beta-lactamase class C family)
MCRYIVMVVLLSACLVPVTAGDAAAPAVAPPDVKTLEKTYDAFFAACMDALRVPGTVISVVKDGRILFTKGYGLASVETRKPVDGESTLFRIGSVSKLFVATAMMQLVDNGALDLDADVNRYLKAFQVPATYPEPVTARHLLMHTAGFDDRFLGIGKPRPADLERLGEYLARRLPPRIQPPGEILNYSNFGIVLAAHLVEAVAGLPFNEYMDRHVFRPLGMAAGGFDQPLPPESAARLATAYTWRDGAYRPAPFSEAASQVWPAGAWAGTAPDMARFMIAHLAPGGSTLFSETAAAEMHRRQFINHPGLTRGQCLGFHERFLNGHRVIWHTGRVNRFTAQLLLAPEVEAGFFAAHNADEGDAMRKGLANLFADLFLPPQTPPEPAPDFEMDEDALARYGGGWLQVRRVRSTFVKTGFAGREIRFLPDGGERLIQLSCFGADPIDTWRPVAPDIFEAVQDGPPREIRRLAFRRDRDGRLAYACAENDHYSVLDAFERLAWYQTTRFHLLLLALTVPLLIAMIVVWPCVSIVRRLIGCPCPFDARTRRARCAGGLGALLLLLFAAGLGMAIALIEPYTFAFGAPGIMLWLLALPPAAGPFFLAQGCFLAACWRNGAGSRRLRIFLTLVFAAGLVLIGQFHAWNLLGWHI